MKPCPYCAESIQDEAIKCRYCGSLLTGAPTPPPRAVSTALHAEVQGLLAQGHKIAAIKRVREETGIGLAQAKHYVDALAAGLQPSLPVAGASPPAIGRPGGAVLKWLVLLAAAAAGWWFTAHRH